MVEEGGGKGAGRKGEKVIFINICKYVYCTLSVRTYGEKSSKQSLAYRCGMDIPVFKNIYIQYIYTQVFTLF